MYYDCFDLKIVYERNRWAYLAICLLVSFSDFESLISSSLDVSSPCLLTVGTERDLKNPRTILLR